MFNAYQYNFLLLFFLFILAPLSAMEINSNDDVLTQFFDAIKQCDVQTVRTLLKNNPNIIHEVNPAGRSALEEAIQIDPYSPQTNVQRPELVELLLKSGAHIENKLLTQLLTSIQGHSICKNHIAHLLFCFDAPMDSDDSQDYENDPENILRIWEREEISQTINNKELTKIIHAHICTRLHKAIKNGDAHEVRRLIKKYKLDINKPLPCYDIMLDYDTPSAIADARKDMRAKQRPLTYAMEYNQNEIADLLVNEFNADPNHNINDDHLRWIFFEETNSIDWTYINNEKPEEIQENHVENAETNYIEAFSEPVDPITWTYSHENTANTAENPIENIANEPILNNPEPNPIHDPVPVITNSTFPWKWIGGGFAVVIISIAAKKLYNWWQINAESQETEDISESQSDPSTL